MVSLRGLGDAEMVRWRRIDDAKERRRRRRVRGKVEVSAKS
jgi:hypothetical protein